MPADYEDTIVHGADEPTIKRRYIDGSEFTFKGDGALAMADTPEAAQWRLDNPKQALLNSYSPFDSMEESHPYASVVRDFVNKHKQEKGFSKMPPNEESFPKFNIVTIFDFILNHKFSNEWAACSPPWKS